MQLTASEWDQVWAEYDANSGAAIRREAERQTAAQEGKRSKPACRPAQQRSGRTRFGLAYCLGLATPLLLAPVAAVLGLDLLIAEPLGSDVPRMSRAELLVTSRTLAQLAIESPGAEHRATRPAPESNSPRATQQLADLAQPGWARGAANAAAALRASP